MSVDGCVRHVTMIYCTKALHRERENIGGKKKCEREKAKTV